MMRVEIPRLRSGPSERGGMKKRWVVGFLAEEPLQCRRADPLLHGRHAEGVPENVRRRSTRVLLRLRVSQSVDARCPSAIVNTDAH
jgi:hypothetical protein